MAIEIVDFPIKNTVNFHSYVKLPEGIVLLQQISWLCTLERHPFSSPKHQRQHGTLARRASSIAWISGSTTSQEPFQQALDSVLTLPSGKRTKSY